MRLYGYSNPSSRVPGVVVPVWMDERGSLHGVFSKLIGSRSGRTIVPIESDGVSVLPEGWLDPSIASLSPLDICMIALSQNNVIAYPFAEQDRILRGLLSDPSFASESPFSRLAFAKLSGISRLVVVEWLNTALHLLVSEAEGRSGARSRIERWLAQEREWIGTFLEDRVAADALLGDFPTSMKALGNATWFRNQLALSGQEAPQSLAQIEDRTPSPDVAAILNLEPVVPDAKTLAIMGRHLLAGTNYVFFHGAQASPASLKELKEAALGALETAKRAYRAPLSVLSPPQSGTISFYRLGGIWTGSPYVFYEETVRGQTVVSGYRGLEDCASIAKSYDKLPDGFAKELLEALVASAPSLQTLGVDGHENRILDLNAALQRRGG